MARARPYPCRETLRRPSHALRARSCSFLMLVLDLIRLLRLPPDRPHALRAAAQKNWPRARSSEDSCPLRKTIWSSLVPGLREFPGKIQVSWNRRIVRHADSPHLPFSQPGQTICDSTKVLRAVLSTASSPQYWRGITGPSFAFTRFPVKSIDFLNAGVAN